MQAPVDLRSDPADPKSARRMREGMSTMDRQLKNALLLIPPGLASLALMAAPAHATSPSNAQLFGMITANGTLLSGSTGISSVTRVGPGKYCSLPTSTTLQNDAANATLGVQLSLWTANWPYYNYWIEQVSNYSGHVTNDCATNKWIGVSIEGAGGAAPPGSTGSTGPSGTLPSGLVYANADFTILFE